MASSSNESSVDETQTPSPRSPRELLQHTLLYGDLESVKQLMDPTKFEELKRVRAEAEKFYVERKISELALNSAHEAANQRHGKGGQKSKSFIRVHSLNQLKLKSRCGQELIPLRVSETEFAEDERKDFFRTFREVFGEKVARLKNESKEAKKKWGRYGTKGDVTKNKEEEARLVQDIQRIQEECEQLFPVKKTMLQELEVVKHNNKLKEAKKLCLDYETLHSKAQLLVTKSSTMKMMVDMEMNKDKLRAQAMHDLGDQLKGKLMKLNNELKYVEETLAKYEKKEESSDTFKRLVEEKNKCETKLKHSKNALELLKERSG